MAKEQLILFISYSRSGGTLMAQCLEAMGEVFVLSEVHPNYVTGKGVKAQTKDRLDIDLQSSDYVSQIKELYQILNSQGKKLVVRDWSFVDFTPHDINKNIVTNTLHQYHLLKNHFDLKVFALVRNPIDIWISRKYPPLFFHAYHNFTTVVDASEIPVYHYEHFCEKPKIMLQEICDWVNIKYQSDFEEHYHSVNLQGDRNLKQPSRGTTIKGISRLKRKRIPTRMLHYLKDEHIAKRLNFNFGYINQYFDEEIEEQPSYFSLNIRHLYNCITGKHPRDQY